MREPDPELRRGLGAGEGRVRVAVDERPVGLLLDQPVLDRGAHEIGVGGAQVEPVARLVKRELLEEDLRKLAVVVLSRVDHDLLETALPQRDRSGRSLDELGPVAHDRDDLHRG